MHPADPKKPRPEDYDRVNADEPADDAYEPTYRDGSAKNECWHDN